MAVVLIAFGGSLLYFLFFNSGLALVSDPSDQAGHILILNDSVHSIHDITLSYIVGGQETGEQTIGVLLPRESYSITLDDHYLDAGKYIIKASAPYHLSRQIIIQTSSNTNPIPALSITFEVPNLGTQNHPVTINLIGRNLDPVPHVVSVSFEWSSSSSGVNPPIQEWGLPPNGEGSLSLSATPLRGDQNLSFKIKVFTPSNVLVERGYSILVLPDMDNNAASQTTDENQMNTLSTDSNSLFDSNSSADANSTLDTNGGVV